MEIDVPGICSRGTRSSVFWLSTLDRPLDCSDVGFLSSFLFYPMDVKAHAMTLWRCLLPLPPPLVGR
jgi:hypothetical protein